jgi:hypothetical protein
MADAAHRTTWDPRVYDESGIWKRPEPEPPTVKELREAAKARRAAVETALTLAPIEPPPGFEVALVSRLEDDDLPENSEARKYANPLVRFVVAMTEPLSEELKVCGGDIAEAGANGSRWADGATGPQGKQGNRGQRGFEIIGWRLDVDAFTATPDFFDGSAGPPISLLPFFQAYNALVDRGDDAEMEAEATHRAELLGLPME